MSNTKLIRLPEVIELTGLSRSSIYAYISQGLFPQPVKIGIRSVAWYEWEIQEWINNRIRSGGLKSSKL